MNGEMMLNEGPDSTPGAAGFRDRAKTIGAWAQRSILGQVWDRMLEIEFIDRSVALASKAFVSFFPLVIVVASFVPESIHDSIFTTVTTRLGIEGDALVTTKQAFASSQDVRRATGLLGLLLTIFFATSFVTALQRVYLRTWRRPAAKTIGEHARALAWFIVILSTFAVLGGLRELLGDGPQLVLFAVVSLATTSGLWWFTAWLMLMGQVRWRVLLPSGVLTAFALAAFALSATIWMPDVVTKDQHQFGFFGVALALVTWFTGAATCVLVGACAGSVLAAHNGRLGLLIRGANPSLLIDSAEPSFPAPERALRLREALKPIEEEIDAS
jgi:membrane protein